MENETSDEKEVKCIMIFINEKSDVDSISIA